MTVERPKDLQRLVGTAWYRTKVQKANRLPSALVSVLRRYIPRRESSWKIFEQKRSAVTLVGEANQFWKIVAEFSFEILDQVAHYDGGMLAFSDPYTPRENYSPLISRCGSSTVLIAVAGIRSGTAR